ncbi:hypothetical protein [Aquabacterium humicola]|uniref:hypothetical protein n=1 Tax=Aquabacterium humicola TaxID=3237377 RepID=UPI0025432B0A|nr:hypothetical protein [Rubrivivax pictus]
MAAMVIPFPSPSTASRAAAAPRQVDVLELLLQLRDAGVAGDRQGLQAALARLRCADEREALALALDHFLGPARLPTTERPYIPY